MSRSTKTVRKIGPVSDLARQHHVISLKGFLERYFFDCVPLSQRRKYLVDRNADQPGRELRSLAEFD
jgi:hypothetical protein